MKLSTMKRVVDTVGEQWESPLAEAILEQWGYDPGTVKYFRASANFAFVFQREGKYYFLRFNDSDERDLQKIRSEIAMLDYLHDAPLHVVQSIKSLNNRYIETVVYEGRTYYAVVFEALPGDQLEIEEMDDEQFFAWGKALGKLHTAQKMLPRELVDERPTWQDHLALARDIFAESEPAALRELERVASWAKGLSMTQENYGLIHYDFELDNLLWNERGASVLDFDDCTCYWYVADIAYALRDLFEEGIDLENPPFQAFINGYRSETELDMALLKEIPMFMKCHDVVSFAKLLRSVDIPDSDNNPEWIANLRSKLVRKLEDYRQSFKN